MNNYQQAFEKTRELLETTCADNTEIFCYWIEEQEFNLRMERLGLVEVLPEDNDFTYPERVSLLLDPEEMLSIVWEKINDAPEIEHLLEFNRKFAP